MLFEEEIGVFAVGELVPLVADRVVYLGGPVTGVADYRSRFDWWEGCLLGVGAKRVINPAKLPDGWMYQEYMAVCLHMLQNHGAEVLCLQPGWRGSVGTVAECATARALNLSIYEMRKRETENKEVMG